jgi:hypothetical protein
MRIPRTVYLVNGESITLAYIPCVGDEHPEVIEGESPPAATPEPPRYYPGERSGPLLTERRIRAALGKDPEKPMQASDQASYARVMQRIKTEGF